MIPLEQITGVVLAGGRSSRFGSDKAMECLAGLPFLIHAVDLLRPLCAHVVVSGGKPEYATAGCPLLEDKYVDCGPLGGIHAALSHCRTPYVLFLTCDMPLMEPAPLIEMLSQLPAPVIGWQGRETAGGIFPLLVSTKLAAEVEQALQQGNYSIRHSVCGHADTKMLPIPSKWMNCFTNINRREDLPRS